MNKVNREILYLHIDLFHVQRKYLEHGSIFFYFNNLSMILRGYRDLEDKY